MTIKTITSKDKDAFRTQRTGAKSRVDKHGNPIEFKLTFEQWWDWWQATGKYDQRGCKRGQYVMARIDDLGPYELGNIVCITHAENLRAAHLGKSIPPFSEQRLANMREAQLGKKWSQESIAKRQRTRERNRLAKLQPPN